MKKQSLPTVFHITHWKAGSQWVYAVLSACAGDRIIGPKVGIAQFYKDPLVPGGVYPTVYVPRLRFEKTLFPALDLNTETYRPSPSDSAEVQNWHNFEVLKSPLIKFVVLRDLRDAMVSLYFSLRVSHPVISSNVARERQALANVEFEEGFAHLIETIGKQSAHIQKSWLPVCKAGDALLVRYEDLIADEQVEFAKIIEYCQIEVSPANLAKIVEANSFSKRTGRKPGDEDVSSHYRKGISGDWKNYFTNRVKTDFKEKLGQVLIDTGYERDLSW